MPRGFALGKTSVRSRSEFQLREMSADHYSERQAAVQFGGKAISKAYLEVKKGSRVGPLGCVRGSDPCCHLHSSSNPPSTDLHGITVYIPCEGVKVGLMPTRIRSSALCLFQGRQRNCLPCTILSNYVENLRSSPPSQLHTIYIQ